MACDSGFTGNTSSSSFTLTTRKQLAGLAYKVNIGKVNFSGKTIYINNDIDLSGYEWVPIGNATTAFAVTFDGMYFMISNLNMSAVRIMWAAGSVTSGTTAPPYLSIP